MLRSCLENTIYNIAENDFMAGMWNEAPNHINSIFAKDESSPQLTLVGLRALKEVVRASDELDTERKPLIALMDVFMPRLENLLTKLTNSTGEHNQEMMILVFKIFLMANRMQLLPMMMDENKAVPWFSLLVSIITKTLTNDDELVVKNSSKVMIEKRDKSDWWKLKGICCKLMLRLF